MGTPSIKMMSLHTQNKRMSTTTTARPKPIHLNQTQRDSRNNQHTDTFLCTLLMLSVTLPRPLRHWGMAVSRQLGRLESSARTLPSTNHGRQFLSYPIVMSSSCWSKESFYPSQPTEQALQSGYHLWFKGVKSLLISSCICVATELQI